jgi:serine/threonine protein kinase
MEVLNAELVVVSSTLKVLATMVGTSVLINANLCSVPSSLASLLVNFPLKSALPFSKVEERIISREFDSIELVTLGSAILRLGIWVKYVDREWVCIAPQRSSVFSLPAISRVLRCTSPQYSFGSSSLGFKRVIPNEQAPVRPEVLCLCPLIQLPLRVLANSSALSDSLQFTPYPLAKPVEFWGGDDLGEGTYGNVCQWAATSLGQVKVSKVLKPCSEFEEFWKYVLCETSHLDRPQVHVIGPSQARLIFDFEFNDTLDGAIQGRSNPVLNQISYMRCITRDLHKMHSRGIAHCDLKSTNIVADSRGNCRVIDWGGSSLYEGMNLVNKCTLDFRAPEVFKGQSTWLPGDIWSLGVIFLDMMRSGRGSLIKFGHQGKWDDGKQWDWSKEEAKISLHQISQRVKEQDLGILEFLQDLFPKPTQVSVGQAFLLSSCLQVLPGHRSSLGLSAKKRPIDLLHWPYPVSSSFTSLPSPQPPANKDDFDHCVENQIGLWTLDGTLYTDSLDIPDPQGRSFAVSAGREHQLMYLCALLSGLKLLTLKHFLISVDFLDRVSTPQCLARTLPRSHRMLENACVVVASMVADFKNVSCEAVCKVWQHLLTLGEPAIKHAPKRLQQTVLQLLCSLQFKATRPDSLWEQCSLIKDFSPLLQGLAHWPDGNRSLSEFLLDIAQANFEKSAEVWFKGIQFPQKSLAMSELHQDWLHPTFRETLVALKMELPEDFSRAQPQVLSLDALQVLEYQKSFGVCHPFFIPVDASFKGISRHDFQQGVEAYISFCTQRIPQTCVDHTACLTCRGDSGLRECTRCQGWVLCTDCFSAQEGHCPQCFSTNAQMQTWIVRTGTRVT